jgi:hypothetical protein
MSAMAPLSDKSTSLVLRNLDGGDGNLGVQKAPIMPVAVEEAKAQRQLRSVCPVVATAKDEGLCDASFATLLIRVNALHQSTATPAIRQLHRMIMDENTIKQHERDAALGQILVLQGAYFSAPFPIPKETRPLEGSTRPLCPSHPLSHEEAIAREKLRVSCPVVVTIKELGLCEETTFVTLLMRSLQLISSQHHSKKFNLCRRVMDEGNADKQRDQALGELLVTHGGYFSRNLFPSDMQNAIYCRWKEMCEVNRTVPSVDMQMQLHLNRGAVPPGAFFEEQQNMRLGSRRERTLELLLRLESLHSSMISSHQP